MDHNSKFGEISKLNNKIDDKLLAQTLHQNQTLIFPLRLPCCDSHI